MDSDKLKRANKLKEEINELDKFIFTASSVCKGKLTIKDKIMRFVTNSYGAFYSKEFEMNTHIKDRVLDLLIEYKDELEEEFKNL